jgi:hypothetical protein
MVISQPAQWQDVCFQSWNWWSCDAEVLFVVWPKCKIGCWDGGMVEAGQKAFLLGRHGSLSLPLTPPAIFLLFKLSESTSIAIIPPSIF